MPIDRGTIDEQLREIGEGERWWELREFRDLPHVLNPGERIRGLASGKVLGHRVPRPLPEGRWLVVSTDQRLICLRQERFGRKQVDIRPEQVTAIRHNSRLRSYQIAMHTAHRTYRIRIPKEDAFRFLATLSALVPGPAAPGAAGPMGLGMLGVVPGLPGLVSKVAGGPAPEYATRLEVARLEGTVERLEGEVERLQQQVEFLEKLMQRRAEEALTWQEPGGEA